MWSVGKCVRVFLFVGSTDLVPLSQVKVSSFSYPGQSVPVSSVRYGTVHSFFEE